MVKSAYYIQSFTVYTPDVHCPVNRQQPLWFKPAMRTQCHIRYLADEPGPWRGDEV